MLTYPYQMNFPELVKVKKAEAGFSWASEDREVGSGYDKPDQYIVLNALLYKFWLHQTGRGVVRTHAKIDELQDRLKDKMDDRNDSMRQFTLAELAFVNAINKLEGKILSSFCSSKIFRYKNDYRGYGEYHV